MKGAKSSGRVLRMGGKRPRPTAQPRVKEIAGIGSSVDITRYFNGSALPRSRYQTAAQYINAMKRDPWLAIGQVRLTKMLMTGRWWIEDTKTGKALPRSYETDSPHPAQVLLEEPMPKRPWRLWVNRYMVHRNIIGEAFVLKHPMSMANAPMRLWLIDPDRIEVVPAKTDEFIAGYKWRTDVGRTIELGPEDIAHDMYMAHPTNPYRGQGIVELGQQHFDITTAMEEWIWSLFTNGTIPDGFISTPHELDGVQFKRMMMQMEERHRGPSRAHRAMVLENGATYTPGTGPKETDFQASRRDRRDETLALTGVPGTQVGLVEGLGFASAYIQDTVFIRNTYLPTCQEIAEFFDAEVLSYWPGLHLRFPETKALSDPIQERSSVVSMVNSGLLTPNEGREQLGMERSSNPALDKHYVPMSIIPIEEVSFAERPAPAGPGAAPEPPGADKPPQEPEVPLPFPDHAIGNEAGGRHEHKVSAWARRVAYWSMRERRGMAHQVKRVAMAFFRWQERQVIERLRASKQVKGIDDIFDLFEDEAAWERTMRRWYGSALSQKYGDTMEMIDGDPQAYVGSPRYQRQLDNLCRDVTRVSETTREKLAQIVDEGVRLGLGPTDIANGTADGAYPGIRGVFKQFSQNRAQLIARTEASAALDQANLAGFEDFNVQIVDVVGCEDDVIVAGQRYGCNSQGIPIREAYGVKFHPNHKGAFAPRPPSGRMLGVVYSNEKAGTEWPKKDALELLTAELEASLTNVGA